MSFWCSATGEPWSWAPRLYLGVWVAVVVLAVLYLRAVRRGAADGLHTDGRRIAAFVAGLVSLWAATDWPLGTLGAGYLATAHMVSYLLYSFVAAPLLLLGMPEWMGRRLAAALRLTQLLPTLSRPLVAGIVYNVVFFATHVPFTVDNVRTTQVGGFLLDVLWLVGGLVLWLPVISPVVGLRARSSAVRCVYLFLASGALPMILGAFLTFSALPLYSTYELAPRVVDLSATDDQQLAGLLMKVGSMPVIWAVMLAIFVAWARREQRHDYNIVDPDAAIDPAGAAMDRHAVDPTQVVAD